MSHNCFVLRARPDLQGQYRVSCPRLVHQGGKLFLYHAVAVFVFKKNLFGSCGFQFPHLSLYVLILISRASRISVNHNLFSFPPHGFCVPVGRVVYQQEMEKRRLAVCLVKAL